MDYTGSGDIWLGTVGGAIRAQCVVKNPDNSLTVCIPANGHYTATSCNCGGAAGVLACPGSSVPSDGGQLCSAAGGKTCGVNAFPDPTGNNKNDCYYTFPQPTKLNNGTNPATWDWEMTGTGVTQAVFCFDPPTITYNGSPIPSGVSASGGIFARTGCLAGAQGGTQCTEGDCSPAPAPAPSSSVIPTPVPNSQCVTGVGPGNPAVQAEFTLQRKATDYYDVTVINGANATIQMEPIGIPKARPSAVPLDYWCEAPGSQTGSKACDWNFANYINTAAVPLPPPPPTLVSPTPTPTGSPTPAPTPDPLSLLIHSVRNCTTDADCPTNWSCTGNPPHGTCGPNSKSIGPPVWEVTDCQSDSDCIGQGGHCLPAGISLGGFTYYACQCINNSDCADPNYPYCGEQSVPFSGLRPFLAECGKFGGWWTADDLCASTGSHQNVGPLDCVNRIKQFKSYLPHTTIRALFGCVNNNAASCYSGDATQSCCGCATDPDNPDYLGTQLSNFWPQDVTGKANGECVTTNNTWVEQIQPWLANLKQACPTAYTYPYDDKTSTFQCKTAGTSNTMAYRVTIGDLPIPSPGP